MISLELIVYKSSEIDEVFLKDLIIIAWQSENIRFPD